MPTARDAYEPYFAEKLWEWIPASYRELDALESGNSLRGLVQALAARAAILKRSQDRLWDDAYIELADDWAVPYIGELVATRLVSALDTRARRIDVAKTIYYRRRKGTVLVLEQLIADMGDWQGRVMEEFRRLARTRHGLDGIARSGRISGTPEGGLADLRAVRGALLTGGPFEEFHYTPDVRRPYGRSGQRGIVKLSFHLYRLKSVGFSGVMPRRLRNLPGEWNGWTFDPSGRDVPLFARGDPQRDWTAWHSAREWELPEAISCRLLGETIFKIGDEEIAWIKSLAPIATQAQRRAAAADLVKLRGERFAGRAVLVRLLKALPSGNVLGQPGVLAGLLATARIGDCGSTALLPDAAGHTPVGAPAIAVSDSGGIIGRDETYAARLDSFQQPPPSNGRLYIEPERGRFVLDRHGHTLASVRVHYHEGEAGPVGAGASGREVEFTDLTPAVWHDGINGAGIPQDGETLVVDSATYHDPPDQPAVHDSGLLAQEGERPYLLLRTSHWRFTADGTNRLLRLDGLWVGASHPHSVVLEGNFEQVMLRYCTFDPGGRDALGASLPPVILEVRGFVEELMVERCILAAIRVAGTHGDIGRIVLSDSIVDASSGPAIDAPHAQLVVRRSTLIGPGIGQLAVNVEWLDASDTLIAGQANVTDTQSGCFRFSARGPESRVPYPYESHVVDDMARIFAMRRFGDPHYATLSPAAPPELSSGAENGSEIGAFASLIAPIRMASLSAKVEEFLPFGRLPNFILEN